MVKTNHIKKDILKVTLLLLAFNALMDIAYSQTYRIDDIRSQYFGYFNFKKTHITLPDTVLNLPYRDISSEKSFIQGMFFDKKQKLETLSDSLYCGLFFLKEIKWTGKQKIPESFVNLLCDNGMVSIARVAYDGQLRYFNNEDPVVKDYKDWYEFWFLGKISINSNYDSYLIFTREKDTSDIIFMRSLFLMNVKDNIITSLAQVAYKFILYGEGPYLFTKAASRGRYCYYDFDHSNNLFVNRFGRYYNVPKEEKYTYYAFDENGYVEVQELKGRKKFIIYKYKHRLSENIR